MNPYKIFSKEFDDLESFYKISSFSTKQIFELYKLEKRLFETDLFQKYSFPTRPSFIKNNTGFLLNQQFFLRELILIRMISALEVYLIENIKFIAANNVFIFKTNDQISFTTAELMSYDSITEIFEKIITKDCRKLSSGGFKKITSYYYSKLKLNISSIPPGQNIMDEYHDRRHLFVHRLGKTDEYYRNKYNLQKAGISINETYLLTAFKDLKYFAESINKFTKALIENKPDSKGIKNERLVIFKFKYKELIPEFVNRESRFWFNDKLVYAKDIIKDVSISEDKLVEIVLFGQKTKVAAFYKNAKNHISATKGLFCFKLVHLLDYNETTITTSTEQQRKAKIIIDEEKIENVKNLLPVQPWNKGVHMIIAEKLALPKKIVQIAIRVLISRGVFKNQINGEIVE
ncbi:MAG: hypothetical protein A2033_05255 [Bacteroidetes bacterium GWA2_31_9]|nr:MAG: hypothetical protein A2033_05255 [Bacteroidetes bacterium GWA2_31_9]